MRLGKVLPGFEPGLLDAITASEYTARTARSERLRPLGHELSDTAVLRQVPWSIPVLGDIRKKKEVQEVLCVY